MRKQFLIGEQSQIGVRHLRNQADLRAAAGFDKAEILLQALVIETAQATEQVDLIRSETDAGVEVAKGAVTAAAASDAAAGGSRDARHGRGIFLHLLQAGCRDRRKQIGALDSILSARRGDVERSDPRIRVVPQGQFDQCL